MKRRLFLFLSATGALSATATSWAISRNQSHLLANYSPQAQFISSRDGLLQLDLEASLSPVTVGSRQVNLLNYNGQFPGPPLEAKAGDTVRIHFRNNLPQMTNLHYHGLHITPTGTGDNPFLSIPPQEQFTYEFTLGKNHPAGTFWYHPHHHHYAAEQVFKGLVGLFIIRGELDEIPEIKAAKEEFLVFHDFAFNGRGDIDNPDAGAFMRGREGNIITINGQIKPDFKISKGGLLRLRLLNASSSHFYRLSLENHPLYLIATDGGAISEPVELTELLLAPGERAEVLVKGDREPQQYRLLNLPYDRGGTNMMGMMGGHRGMGMMGGHRGMGMMGNNDNINSSNQKTPEVLGTLSYEGTTQDIPLPTKLIPVEFLPTPETTHPLELSMAMGMEGGMTMIFLLNGQTFDPNRIDKQVKLNSVEDWELINIDRDRMDHPFHLHVNSFQVISRNGKPEPYPAWKDTVVVKGGESIKIRIPFRDFTGKTVYHCHILDHEDLGMMGIINISA